MYKIIRSVLVMILLMSGTACTTGSFHYDGKSNIDKRKEAEKERVLIKSKNYERLITINRDELKKKENPETRFKLAEYYFLANDYNASLHYLKYSLEKNPSARVYLLQSKNLAAQKNNNGALKFVNMAISNEPRNAEALNLRGIILAETGNLSGALGSFEQARNAFYPEEKVVNNIALVHIAERKYTQAVQMLLPLYLRGDRDEIMIHNLIFALAKTGDLRYAREIIKRENITKNPDGLVSSLFEIESNLSSI